MATMAQTIEIYPEPGQCDIDMHEQLGHNHNRWFVNLYSDHHHIQTLLENGGAEPRPSGQPCITLGIEINTRKGAAKRIPGMC